MQKAVNVQNVYNKAAELAEVSLTKLLDLQKTHSSTLIEIREKCRVKVEALLTLIESYQEEPDMLDSDHNHMIEETIFTEMRSISINCNDEMIKLADCIVLDSVSLIGAQPLCSFFAVAMGSLARGEATPYSDLEFFFIIEEKNPVTERYFEHQSIWI